jgi:hypothetical protein
MAPNRKQLLDVVAPLIDTTQLVQAKYLPLTHVEASATTTETDTVSNVSNEDYWSWTSTAPAATEAEEKTDLFSASHLEANLVQASKQEQEPKTTVSRANASSAPSDDYWAERIQAIRSNNANATLELSSDDYWYSPEEPEKIRDVQIAMILKEELARHLVSADAMEQRLVQQAAQAKNIPSKAKAENDSYWQWDTPTTVHAPAGTINESYWEWSAPEAEDTHKARLIASILQYEANRQLVSTQRVQDNLIQEAEAQASSCGSTQHAAANDRYWSWNTKSLEDDYWNMRPMPATVAGKGYWDW